MGISSDFYPNEQFLDIALPSILPLPPPPEDESELLEYTRTLHEILRAQQAKLARAIGILGHFRSVQGLSDDRPVAQGSGVTWFEPDTNLAYYDPKLTLSQRNAGLATWIPLYATSPLGTDKVGEPLVARNSGPPVIDLGDDVVVQNTPHDPAMIDSGDQPNTFIWDRESGDILVGVTVK